MFFITLIVLVFIIWLVTRNDKSIVNPISVTCGLWLFLIVIYECINHQLYKLSDSFYEILLLWICPFSISYFVLMIMMSTSKRHIEFVPSNFIYKNIFIFLFIILLFAYDLLKFNEIKNYGLDGLIHFLREINVDKANGELSISSYEIMISRIIQFSSVLLLIYLVNNFKFKLKPLFVILFIIQLLSAANKFVIARFVFGYLVILIVMGKISKKKLLVVLCGVFLFFGVFNYFRRANPDDFDAFNTIQIYLLAPLTAFDSYIINSHSDALFTTTSFGEHVFASIRNHTFTPEYFENDNLVFVPLPVNVFTMMCSYYIDFKTPGIFIAGLLWGLFFSYIYIRSKKSEVHLILYAAVFYVLVLQFFADFLITSQIRMHITLIFALLFIFYHPLIKRIIIK